MDKTEMGPVNTVKTIIRQAVRIHRGAQMMLEFILNDITFQCTGYQFSSGWQPVHKKMMTRDIFLQGIQQNYIGMTGI